MEKTVIEWLETIADKEIREKLIGYAKKDEVSKCVVASLDIAIYKIKWYMDRNPIEMAVLRDKAIDMTLATREVDQVGQVKEVDYNDNEAIQKAIDFLKGFGFKVMK